MDTQETTCYCRHCKKDVTFHFEKQQINHAQNLGLSIFTLGIWLPIWLFMAFLKTKTCDKCGEPLTEE